MKLELKSRWKTLSYRKCFFRSCLALLVAYLGFAAYFYCDNQGAWFTEPNADPASYRTTNFAHVSGSFSVPEADPPGSQSVHYRKYAAMAHPVKGTIYYLHGSKGNMDKCESEIETFLLEGYDVWTMDYRGFGQSAGSLSEDALLDDAWTVYGKITSSGVDESDIVVWGRSFGSGVAASVAARASPRMLVLETPYWSLPDAARFQYLLLPDFLFHYELPTHEFLSKVECRIELIHGTKDEKIPFSSTERLYLLCRDELKLKVRSEAITCGLHDLRPEQQFKDHVKSILK